MLVTMVWIIWNLLNFSTTTAVIAMPIIIAGMVVLAVDVKHEHDEQVRKQRLRRRRQANDQMESQ